MGIAVRLPCHCDCYCYCIVQYSYSTLLYSIIVPIALPAHSTSSHGIHIRKLATMRSINPHKAGKQQRAAVAHSPFFFCPSKLSSRFRWPELQLEPTLPGSLVVPPRFRFQVPPSRNRFLRCFNGERVTSTIMSRSAGGRGLKVKSIYLGKQGTYLQN